MTRYVQPTSVVTLRSATADDLAALGRLAALDSARVPSLPALIAEVDSEPRAAVSLADGTTVADPFQLTNALVRMLEMRAEQLRDGRTHATWTFGQASLIPFPG
jgi:hypothetical protein